jgi:hypothetical protein
LGVVLCQAAAARVPSGLPRVPRPAARLCDRGWRTVRPLWRRVCKTTGWLTVRPLRRRVCKTTGWRTVRPLRRRVCKRWWFGSNWWHWHWHLALAAVGLGSSGHWLDIDFGIGVQMHSQSLCLRLGLVQDAQFHSCTVLGPGSNWWHWHLALAADGLGSSGHWLDIGFGIGVQTHSHSLCLRLGLVQDAQFHSSRLRLGLVQDAQSLGLAATGGIGIGTWHWQELAWAAVGIGYDPLLRPCFLQQFLGGKTFCCTAQWLWKTAGG